MVRTAHASILAEPHAILRSATGAPVPLTRVAAAGRLAGLVLELSIEQSYENSSPTNLEAVFTFPLPQNAVLLGFDLTIGERKLSARAVERTAASERYEQAIDAGDSAALIEHDGNGLYTVSLGNLLPRETAVVRYRYAELLDAHEGYLRVRVPTVIAPRYGNPRDAGLDGPAIPGVDLLGEYPFDLRLEIAGLASAAGVRSASHAIATEVGAGGLVVRLAGEHFLDRDFVLDVERAALPKHALVARDGEGYVLVGSATLGLDRAEQRPLALKILLDCSGSMGGDSIAAAKRALLAILERLGPDDRVSLTRFGSTLEHVTEGLEPADESTLDPLRVLVKHLDADLGGTEMKAALVETLAIEVPRNRQADLVLITDGQIYDVASVVDRAATAGHRLFAIAIGTAPVEALARSLAARTGGACEFVGPSEDPEAAILRTFKRLRCAPRTLTAVDWPVPPAWTAPLPTAVFPGDTLHVIAGFAARPSGTVKLTVRDHAGRDTLVHLPLAADLETGTQRPQLETDAPQPRLESDATLPHLETDAPLPLESGDLLPRLAAARRLGALGADAARELALKYQLATEHTSFVVVAARADGEQASDLPITVAVSHMLAAGWGASAHGAMEQLLSTPAFCLRDVAPDALRREAMSLRVSDRGAGYDRAFLTSSSAPPRGPASRRDRPQPFTPAELAALLQSLAAAHARGNGLPRDLLRLKDRHGLADHVYLDLRALVNDAGLDETTIVAVLLALLAESDAAAGLTPTLLAAMRSDVLGNRELRGLRRRVRQRVLGRAPVFEFLRL